MGRGSAAPRQDLLPRAPLFERAAVDMVLAAVQGKKVLEGTEGDPYGTRE